MKLGQKSPLGSKQKTMVVNKNDSISPSKRKLKSTFRRSNSTNHLVLPPEELSDQDSMDEENSPDITNSKKSSIGNYNNRDSNYPLKTSTEMRILESRDHQNDDLSPLNNLPSGDSSLFIKKSFQND